MFKNNGELFYPAFQGDPSYGEFINGTNFTSGGPSALAEFFGDFMVVNGKVSCFACGTFFLILVASSLHY